MKAKIKETGLIADVTGYTLKRTCVTSNGEECFNFNFPIEAVEIIKDDIDWEQRGFELVKAAMQGILSSWTEGLPDSDTLVRYTFEYANAVLDEYRKHDFK